MSKKILYAIFDDEEVLLNSVKTLREKDINIQVLGQTYTIKTSADEKYAKTINNDD